MLHTFFTSRRISLFVGLLLTGVVMVASSLVITSGIHAQTKSTNLDITVSPFVFDYSKAPGSVVKDKIRVRNNTTASLALRVDVKKLVASGDKIDIRDVSAQQDDSIAWIKFDTPKFTARPQEWVELPFTLTIPQDAAFSYDWAIAVTQDVSQNQGSNTSTVTGSAAIPMLLNVLRPGAKADAQIVGFTSDKKLYEYPPVSFSVTIANTGNVHIKPHGNVFVEQGAKQVALLDINQSEGRILPQSNRTFTTSWDDGFIAREPVLVDNTPKLDKNGNPETKLTIHWNKLTSMRIGKYSAKVFMIFDNGQKDVTLEGNTTFWVIPYTFIGIVLGTIVVLAVLIRFLLKWYVKRAVKKQMRYNQ